MDAETREALEGSIRKWKAIVDGSGVDKGADNCPLCDLFLIPLGECMGCPVSDKVCADDCRDTPYFPWRKIAKWVPDGAFRSWVVHDSASRAAAQAELDFLISLRPNAAASAVKGTP